MALSWGERSEIERDAKSSVRGALVDRENRVDEREKELDKKAWKLGFKEEQLDEKEVYAQERITADGALARKKFEVEKVGVEIDRARILAKEQDVNDTIARLKDAHAAELLVKEAEWKAQGLEKYTALLQTSSVDKATSEAKDRIIEEMKSEIARLDELLKVTMGKLTQIDVKGLTIHVESAKGGEQKKA